MPVSLQLQQWFSMRCDRAWCQAELIVQELSNTCGDDGLSSADSTFSGRQLGRIAADIRDQAPLRQV